MASDRAPSDEAASEREPGGGGRSAVLVLCALATLLIPLVYLVSSGPVEWLMANGYVSYDDPYVEAFYYPGERLMEAFPPLDGLVRWWLSWWK